MPEKIISEMEEKINKAIDFVKKEFASIRTGRASPNLLEGVMVSYYGTQTPLQQVASISCPEPRYMVIQAWDKSALEEIQKAILKANLGLTPVNDGKVIRISIPSLTEERRKEFVKLCHRIAEEGKVSLRNSRREAREKIKEKEKKSEIGEDEAFKVQADMDRRVEKFINQIDILLEAKGKELLEV